MEEDNITRGHEEVPADAMTLGQRIAKRQIDIASRKALLWYTARQVAEAAKSLGAERVLVFGSLARDEVGPESDADICVIWNTPLRGWGRVKAVLDRLPPDIGSLDLLVWTPAEVSSVNRSEFADRILREGVSL